MVVMPLGLPGYLTTSAQTQSCRAHPPSSEGCPLDYAMLAGDLLLLWALFMIKFLLPIMLAGAVLVVAARRVFRGPRWQNGT